MARIAKWKEMPKEDFIKVFNESYSYRELARKIGYSPDGGGTMKSLRAAVQFYNLDDSHFYGQGWNKDNYDWDSFSKNSYKKRGKTTLKPLIYLRGQKCENCGITEWLGEPIKLEIHHKNGDRSDNSLDNLQLLCPNCHAYTETYCHKSKFVTISDETFIEALKTSKSIHEALGILGLTQAGGNYARAYKLIYQNNILHLQQEHQDEKSLE